MLRFIAGDAFGLCIKANKDDLIRVMIRCGLDVNRVTGGYGKKGLPLHWAAGKSTVGTIRLLLEHGALVNAVDSNGESALHVAIMYHKLDHAELLISYGADVNQRSSTRTPLLMAVRYQQPHFLTLLLDRGAKIEGRDERGRTPLCAAVEARAPDIVKILIAHGADVNLPESVNLMTPLHLANESESQEIVEMLLEHQAEVNVRDKRGKTPLHYATRYGLHRATQRLIECGARVNENDKNRKYPLHNAASRGFPIIVEMLVQNGAWVNAQDKQGNTPLHVAENDMGGPVGIARSLFRGGASLRIRNKNKKTGAYRRRPRTTVLAYYCRRVDVFTILCAVRLVQWERSGSPLEMLPVAMIQRLHSFLVNPLILTY